MDGHAGVGVGVGGHVGHRALAVEQPTEDQSGSDCCQRRAGKIVLQPPPPAPSPFQTVSPSQMLPGPSFSRVPPTATTCGEEAGNSA